ncbi:MAG: right-handed parallel beta-helix repeat-containing protein [Saprospiraceae bacterium]|nr:right-handed parallel beta-helix repeat-containing protein [Saprospiraceae bacterium]
MKISISYLLLGVLFTVVIAKSCIQEHFTTDPKDQPEYSVDTLNFDTVFTTIGSATLFFKVYNRHNDFIRIRKIKLAGLRSSHFRINIDGIPAEEFNNIDIRPKDSIYVFCELKINPSDPLEISPFIIQDSIVFETHGVETSVLLFGRGQNANYFPVKSNKGQLSYIDLQGQTLRWSDPKPYIVYGIVYIDNGILEINAGTKVHFFGGITKAKDAEGNTFFYNDGRLIIGKNASIKILGTKDNRVILQGVRLESQFKDVPGQWSGLFIDKESGNNIVSNAEIRNNLIGISLDSLSECEVRNCIFSGNSYFGINAYSSTLTATNCLFYNQGQSSVSLQGGGNYIFNYCTLANFSNEEVSCFVSNNFCVDPPFCTEIRRNHLNAEFVNCIFTGNSSDEFYMRKDVDQTIMFDLKLDHCLLRINDLIKPNQYPFFMQDYCKTCYLRQSLDSLFEDISKSDFRPDSLSFLEKKGRPINMVSMDLNGNLRDLVNPDLGCYEYQY